MNVILFGGGDLKKSKPTDAVFKKLLKGKHILYIPVAWQGDFSVLWGTKMFKPLGLTFETWMSVRYKTYKDLAHFDGIYIGGGNTFALLQEFRDAGFIPHLQKFIATGKPVYGSSAGAIIFGSDIGTASFGDYSDENLPKMKKLDGLDVTRGYAVGCHYTLKDDAHYKKYSRRHAVIALPDETSLHVEKGKMTIIGASAYLFEDGEKTELPEGSTASYK
jgi:dipeptidase E